MVIQNKPFVKDYLQISLFTKSRITMFAVPGNINSKVKNKKESQLRLSKGYDRISCRST